MNITAKIMHRTTNWLLLRTYWALLMAVTFSCHSATSVTILVKSDQYKGLGGPYLYLEDTSTGKQYWGRITDKSTQMSFPRLRCALRGYKDCYPTLPPLILEKGKFPLDSPYCFYGHQRELPDLRSAIRDAKYNGTHWNEVVLLLKAKVVLERDPAYLGPAVPNHVKLVVNSEPSGARIYEEDRPLGTTPLSLDYSLNNECYDAGSFKCRPLTAVHEGCLTRTEDIELRIDPEWRYCFPNDMQYNKLFLLEGDRNYQPPVVLQPPVVEQPPVAVEESVTVPPPQPEPPPIVSPIGILIKVIRRTH
jgi:hypothetical protein